MVIDDENLIINGSIIPNDDIINEIKLLKKNCLLVKDNVLVASFVNKEQIKKFNFSIFNKFNLQEAKSDFCRIAYPWDIFRLNEQEIKNDFQILTKNRVSSELDSSNNFTEQENIFIEAGASIRFVTLNPAGGYIYIGKDAEIMEGSLIRGSLAMCNNSVLKLGTKIYGAVTIGPFSKIGGEVNNSVIQGYSNKAHDGFLGNSVIGEWCNIGADTNNSNLKNNYTEVKLWNYNEERFILSGLQFCGLIMGDHSKCGINTMFNTGTVVGVSANIFGSGFPRNFIPSFSWGGKSGFSTYNLSKAIETAAIVMKRRSIKFDDKEKFIFKKIFENSSKYRVKI